MDVPDEIGMGMRLGGETWMGDCCCWSV